MTDILSRWLNEELRLSKVVDPKTFAKDFSSGYLIGEVLHKYRLQNDFSMFLKKDTSISKQNNFTRLEPTLHLLGIPFDVTSAQGLMQEKPGVATHLLYQLYISLEQKKTRMNKTAMDMKQPGAIAGLYRTDHETPHSDATIVQVPKPPPYTSLLNLKRRQKQQQRREQQAQTVQTEIAQFETNRKKLLMSGCVSSSSFQSLAVNTPPGGSHQGFQVPTSGTKVILQSNSKYIQEIRQRFQENTVACEQREKRRNTFLVEQLKAHEAQEEERREEQLVRRLTRQSQQEQRLAVQLLQIRMQKDVMCENRLFREQQYQQRRQRDFQEALEREAALVWQAKSDHAEEIRMELEMCNTIAAEHAQSRHKKNMKNCKEVLEQIVDLATKVAEYRLHTGKLSPVKLMREWKELLFNGLHLYEPANADGQQPSAQDAAELKKQEILNKQDYEEYTSMTGEWVWPEDAGETSTPPTNNNILGHVVLRLRNIVYPSLTEFPAPTVPHFTLKACFLGKVCSSKTTCLAKIAKAHGIYVLSVDTLIEEALRAYRDREQATEQGEVSNDETEQGDEGSDETEEEKDQDAPEQREEKNQDAPEQREEKDPDAPQEMEEKNQDAPEQREEKDPDAPQEMEEKDQDAPEQMEEDDNQLITSSTTMKSGPDTQEDGTDSVRENLSRRALLGEAAEQELRKGSAIPNELVIAIIMEAVRRIPAGSGWVLDGFPVDVTQARLLEKALNGSADTVNDNVSRGPELAVDPNPPKPPPPPPPALDLAVLLDIPDECAVTRAVNQTVAATSHPTDNSLFQAQIPHRITLFQETWPKLEEWFGATQKILVQIDADVKEEELCQRVEHVLQEIMMRQETASPPSEDEVLDGGECSDSAPVDQTPDVTNTDTSPPESRPKDVHEQSKKSKAHRGQTKKTSLYSSPNDDATKQSEASLCDGSVYVDEPLHPDVPEYLCHHWEAVCDTYESGVKAVMQELRSEYTHVICHLFNIREDYKHYLSRPDLKQNLVSQWQKDFNSIPDDLREDEETKAELHQRLDDLQKHLWELSDQRKKEDESELAAVIGNGWLEDHTAVLRNHHTRLVQVELDRFQDTVLILRDYYGSMYKSMLLEPPSDIVCIPLLESPDIKDPEEKQDTSMENTNPAAANDDEGSRRTRLIPLLPRQPDSYKMNGQEDAGPVKPSHEKLLSDHKEALTAISKLVSEVQMDEVETKELEEKQEKEKKKEKGKEKEKEKDKEKDKEKKSNKKNQGKKKATAASDEVTTDEHHHEEVKIKIHKEYTAALAHEEQAVKLRIRLVKSHGLTLLQFLNSQAQEAFATMRKWLEEYYTAERKSIDQLTEVVRHHIESNDKLQLQMVLECTDFYLNGSCHLVESVPAPSRPPPVKKPPQSTLTVPQLESLHRQLRHVAPSGFITSFEFFTLLRGLVSVNMGKSTLPELWTSSEKQLMTTVSLLTDEFELVDWRRFLLSAALPWPLPSITQLLAVLERMKAADTGDTGCVTEEEYLQTELWFSDESVQPVDSPEPLTEDRLTGLRKFFFRLFADHSSSPPRLDYVSMLQYLAADPSPTQGFIRVLSVVTGQHLQPSSSSQLVQSMPCIDEDAEVVSAELDGACAPSSSSELVSIAALLGVICHKMTKVKDNILLPPGCMSPEENKEHLVQIFSELGRGPEEPVPFSLLCQHPFTQSLMESTARHQLIDVQRVLLAHQEEGLTAS